MQNTNNQLCPCYSGKPFKFCCQPFYPLVEEARQALEENKVDEALKIMEDLTTKYPRFPQVWCYQAQVFYSLGRFPEADNALDRAFAIDPNYANAFWFRGEIRMMENDPDIAIRFYFMAIDNYDPRSDLMIAQCYQLISQIQFQLQRPIAGKAALLRAAATIPNNREIQTILNQYEQESNLPETAKKDYKFRAVSEKNAEMLKKSLDQLSGTGEKLSEVANFFEEMVKIDSKDGASWFNLGLTYAWLGDHLQAVEKLNKSLDLENDLSRAEETGALIELLLCGQGTQDLSDYLEFSLLFQLSQPQTFIQFLQEMDQAQRISGLRSEPQQQMIQGIFLEEKMALMMGLGSPVCSASAHFLIMKGILRLWHTNKEILERFSAEMKLKLAGSLRELRAEVRNAAFGDLNLESIAFPRGDAFDVSAIGQKMKEQARQYWEETWPKRPLRSLKDKTPLEVVDTPDGHKRLLGIVAFLEDCTKTHSPQMQLEDRIETMLLYDFAPLRERLKLPPQSYSSLKSETGSSANCLPTSPTAYGFSYKEKENMETNPSSTLGGKTIDSGTIGSPATSRSAQGSPHVKEAPHAKIDFNTITLGQLGQLNSNDLSESQLAEAFQASLRYADNDLASKFARVITDLAVIDPALEKHPYFQHLIDQQQINGNFETAAKLLSQAEQFDQQHHQGKRALDYGLKRAQLTARQGNTDQTQKTFSELIAQFPKEDRIYGNACETMLRLKNGAFALQFAEQGLALARSKNSRDSEQYFLELCDAAKRQIK